MLRCHSANHASLRLSNTRAGERRQAARICVFHSPVGSKHLGSTRVLDLRNKEFLLPVLAAILRVVLCSL